VALPDTLPVLVGVKEKLKLADAPAAKVIGTVPPVNRKSEFAIERAVMVAELELRLYTVTVCGKLLVTPVGCGAKIILVGKTAGPPARIEMKIAVPAMPEDEAVMVADPRAEAVANPVAVMVTAPPLLLQVTELVRSCVVPLLYVPVAVNCCVPPWVTVMSEGLSASETSVAGVTVKVADPVMEDELAVIVAEPAATPVAKPVPAIVAIVGAEEVQRAEAVRSCVVPSL
jgi:hypothetical protein